MQEEEGRGRVGEGGESGRRGREQRGEIKGGIDTEGKEVKGGREEKG